MDFFGDIYVGPGALQPSTDELIKALSFDIPQEKESFPFGYDHGYFWQRLDKGEVQIKIPAVINTDFLYRDEKKIIRLIGAQAYIAGRHKDYTFALIKGIGRELEKKTYSLYEKLQAFQQEAKNFETIVTDALAENTSPYAKIAEHLQEKFNYDVLPTLEELFGITNL